MKYPFIEILSNGIRTWRTQPSIRLPLILTLAQSGSEAYDLSSAAWKVWQVISQSIESDRLDEELKRQFCDLLGQSYNSPLSLTVAAGVLFLPALLKFMNIMSGKLTKNSSYIIFFCLVSKEQATEDNHPMLLSCGHVLCDQSILKMSMNSTEAFKFPYCPFDIDAAQCMQLCL
ncbi:RING-type zinc-finger, LisH dimerization motif protein [Medicago truncatula]|uniref:RING-type zinc-finger, LisH dimerization motif protein n=1 Tax=Medicago truncatula TaxID=3880 RepID=G7JY29_MEDTR|nr:RING-type zinc-finger, LisH dimerization motif protein [Medicago truncatula]